MISHLRDTPLAWLVLAMSLSACNKIEEVSVTISEEFPETALRATRFLLVSAVLGDRGATPGYCLYISAPDGLSYAQDSQSTQQGAAMPVRVCPTSSGCRIRTKDRGLTRIKLSYAPSCAWAPVVASLYEMGVCDGPPGALIPPLATVSKSLGDDLDGAVSCQTDLADLSSSTGDASDGAVGG